MITENFKKFSELATTKEKIDFVRGLPKEEREDVLMTILEEIAESDIVKTGFIEFAHAFDDFYKPLFENLGKEIEQKEVN